ncbi:hypothetical protein [Dysgonomonas sp. GY617]|uniref:hypothetical protein n=1 Tax=Dysgonomonas sp. GY617 TaxID=2780420 RepID=UPI001883F0F4|nr:hypothetical protein [Dysgonomonas sp. GY617]
MNDHQDNSRRRIAEIKVLQERIEPDTVATCLARQFQECEGLEKQKALNICIDALNHDINDKVFDLGGFYKFLNHYRILFSKGEQICLIEEAESIIRDAITIEELKSRERVFEAETKYIAEQGYVLNQRYNISYPGNPEDQSQEWVVTEFRVYGSGKIHPVHGCKIKKDGIPYAKARYISIKPKVEFVITPKESE